MLELQLSFLRCTEEEREKWILPSESVLFQTPQNTPILLATAGCQRDWNMDFLLLRRRGAHTDVGQAVSSVRPPITSGGIWCREEIKAQCIREVAKVRVHGH